MRALHCTIAVFAAVAPLGAQSGGACPMFVIDGVVQQPAIGPGEAFGVTAYQCASCAFKRDKDLPTEYSFSAEPIVLEIASWSILRAGDVIEAVNGQPITTRTGAHQFTYPSEGESVIMVRRSGVQVEVRATARAQCLDLSRLDPSSIDRVDVLKGAAAEALYGSQARGGVVHILRKANASRWVTDSLARAAIGDSAKSPPSDGRFGFAISCIPSCTRSKTADGTEYYKFDGYPSIAGIRAGGPAAMTGLRVGDLITEIDGISILKEEGAVRFQRSERKESLHVTVMRDGKKVGFLLQAR